MGLVEDDIAADSVEKHFNVNAFLCHSAGSVSINDLYQSSHFYSLMACLFSMAQNYGYETLMTELPTYMKQVLRFSIKTVSGFG